MRKVVGYFALVASICLLLAAAGAAPASADPNSPGNNGTIKIHESPRTTSGTTTTTTSGAASGSASTGVVAGVQTAPQVQAVAGVQNLPSTSTDSGQTPLIMLGMVIFATGVVLLRRPTVVPNP